MEIYELLQNTRLLETIANGVLPHHTTLDNESKRSAVSYKFDESFVLDLLISVRMEESFAVCDKLKGNYWLLRRNGGEKGWKYNVIKRVC